MEPDELYNKLQEIVQLEPLIKKLEVQGQIEFGDKNIRRYNYLINSIPKLSVGDILKYHKYLENETKSGVSEELKKSIDAVFENFDLGV